MAHTPRSYEDACPGRGWSGVLGFGALNEGLDEVGRGCFASKPPAAANRELVPSCLTFLLGEEAEALEGAGMRSFRELRQDRWGKLGRAGQASAVSSCYRCVSPLGCYVAHFPWG